ncbi:hypothetical protein EDB85DRAFT_2152748 [Lactarius pseudohatsudake]|nr:hypothetical protein EDB85DRAFT_2152748 [Lactarius pseudohatsudake]
MPVPSTALVTVLPSLYLNSKAPPPLSTPPRHLRLRHPTLALALALTLTSFVPTPARLSAQRLHPFPLPLAVFAFAALLSLSLSSSPLPTSFPPPLAPNLEWQWSIDPSTHRTSPPDTPEVSFGLYLTNVVTGLTNAVGAL